MASTAEPLWGDAYARANREPAFGRTRHHVTVVIATPPRPHTRPLAQIAPADLDIPILGQ